MAEKNKNIIFRRVRGRIIPIRVKSDDPRLTKNRRKIAAGAAAVIGGLAITALVGVGSGKVARSALKSAKKALFKKRVSPLIKDPRLKRLVSQRAEVQQTTARVKFKVSEKLFVGGAIGLGGLFIGEGITRIGEGLKKREATLPEEVIGSATGIGVSAFAAKAFKLGLRSKL